MAQALRSSLTWDTERMGTELYPVVMRALDAIEEAREASEEAAKALDERADTLIQELNRTERGTAQPKRQMTLRLPIETFEDVETLRMIKKCNEEDWSANETIAQLIIDYVEKHRTEITEFQERNRTR